MKTYCITLLFLLISATTHAQINGRVLAEDTGEALAGATVRLVGINRETATAANGTFHLPVNAIPGDSLLVSFIGYVSRSISIDNHIGTYIEIKLERDAHSLQEVGVVSTGYQSLPRERATGSFSYVGNELLQNMQTPDIVGRLEGVSNGLLFDRRQAVDEDRRLLTLRIRGAGSIFADQTPLIVVNGFPFEGNMNSINPNDVEDVTILKDAAAASIWGARAANGVIVIRLKDGDTATNARVTFSNAVTFHQRPDLFKNSDMLDAKGTLEWERILFENGSYLTDEQSSQRPMLTQGVELFIKQRDGLIRDEDYVGAINRLEQIDIRNDAEKHLYQRGVGRQFSLGIAGGAPMIRYYLSGSVDINDQNIKENKLARKTLNVSNTMQLSKRLRFSSSVMYADQTTQRNGIGLHNLDNVSPYARLVDDSGLPVAVIRDYRMDYVADAESDGLLNWQYRPLDEVGLNDFRTDERDFQLNVGTHFKINEDIELSLKYQYHSIIMDSRDLHHQDSYMARDLVNRFTQADGIRIIQQGAVVDDLKNTVNAHNGRLQVEYSKSLRGVHTIDGVAGAEVRERESSSNGFRLYGYNDDILTSQNVLDFISFYPVRPSSSARINSGYNGLMSGTLDRFLSYYGNLGYNYADKYQLSASVRRDASNLFGVRQNQRWAPLWSVGGAWKASSERFFQSSWLNDLRVRLTWGYNGNIDKSTAAYLTAQYLTDNLTTLPYAQIQNPGNPDLKWETTRVLNLGADFSLFSRRITGVFEVYSKYIKDMLGQIPAESTSGYAYGGGPPYSYRVNYANMKTRGLDMELTWKALKSKTVDWSVKGMFSFVDNRVTDYQFSEASTFNYLARGNFVRPREGFSLDALYSLPWGGLDAETGNPRYMLDGMPTMDYSALRNFPADQLVYSGVSVPTMFGSVMSNLRFKNIMLSALVSYRGGYYFRRNTVFYSAFKSTNAGHIDFNYRWRKPGDEVYTDVPSIPIQDNANRDRVYADSEELIEPGDHVRLQNLALTYDVGALVGNTRLLDDLKLSIMASNIGVLWRKNKVGVDPDYYGLLYPPPRVFAVRLNLTL